MTKTLAHLLSALPFRAELAGDPQTRIEAPVVESDADVAPGGVFVARVGLSSDGHDFIERAIARGAAAVVGERALPPLPVPYVRVDNAAEAIGLLAAAYHDFPSRQLRVIGVTGTDGKTTTSLLLHSILQQHTGGRAGLISTIAAQIGQQTIDTGLHVTTPGAPQVQALLAQMVASGLTHCVVEMTSHGLAQGRLNGIDVAVAVLTNLTHEHLDYHGTFEAYRAAKARMFAMLTPDGTSVINADDPNASFFAAIPAARRIFYGLSPKAEARAVGIVHHPHATAFTAMLRGRPLPIALRLVGRFNVLNALAAASAAASLGIEDEPIAAGLSAVAAIPGRLERIDEGQPFIALVDFAHTPNALSNVLEAARELTKPGGRVIAVFGSAGLRDREKRRLMAEIGTRLADLSILTAEDPRTESLDAILATMAEAAAAVGGVEGKTFIRIPDRGAALLAACQRARAGDVVIACGKGHEQSLCFGTTEYPWDDRAALRAALRGSPLRTLPTAQHGGQPPAGR